MSESTRSRKQKKGLSLTSRRSVDNSEKTTRSYRQSPIVIVVCLIAALELSQRSLPSSLSTFTAVSPSSTVLPVPLLGTDANANANANTNTNTNAGNNNAYKQSFGLLNDVSNEEWEKIRQTANTQSIYNNPANPLERVDETEYWMENNLTPNFDCKHKEQVGGQNLEDGVKFICNPKRLITPEKKDCLIYSIGSAGNFVFEDAMYEIHNSKCEIHVFDPASKWARKDDPTVKNIHYHAWGFVSEDRVVKSKVWPAGSRGGFKTFQETLKELGHEGKTIDLFKIDCEGCEYNTYQDWIGYDIRQILVEVHGVPTLAGGNRWFPDPLDVSVYYGDYLKNGYALYHKHIHGNGIELGYLKLDPEFWKA